MKEYKKFDLHMHTLYSDGLGTVKQMIRQAELVGLSLISLLIPLILIYDFNLKGVVNNFPNMMDLCI